MVNPDVDGHTKTLNHRKIPRKTHKQQQPTENQKNTISEDPVFTFSLPVGRFPPASVTPLLLNTMNYFKSVVPG